MIRLSKKFIRRAITGLALLAPVVYLFGTQFAALAGAHGEEVLAGDNLETYSSSVSLLNDTWVNANGQVISEGSMAVTDSILLMPYTKEFSFTLVGTITSLSYSRLSFFGPDGFISYVNFPSSLSGSYVVPEGCISVRVGLIFGRDFTCDFSFNYYSSSDYRGSYSKSLFADMFGKSNFLTSWGLDAISDNPHGFAPFGNMLQFVDENMLHLSDLQIGLMGYGYFYYCAHVLLFVCFFDLTTFFLSWILRITHKFGGADYED